MTNAPACGFTEADLLVLIPALTAFSRRFTPNQTDSDDLVQETILKAWSKRNRFTPGTSLKSWLFTIMRNTFCTRYRLAQRERPLDADTIDRMGTAALASEQEWHLYMQNFLTAFEGLPHYHQEAIVGIVVNGDTYEAMAENAGCQLGTIKSRVNRAREKLRAQIGYEGFI